MKLKTFVTLIALLASALLVGFVATSSQTSAVRASDWKAGNIISDSKFTNNKSMSVGQIQSFLDKRIGSCDVWGKGKATEFGSSLTRAQYAKKRGWAGPPYVCLNKYHEVPKLNPGKGTPANNWNKDLKVPKKAKSAAWIIKNAADRYKISPKVLLVKIATESSGPLTSDNWPLFSQYRYAMGSHCPDSGPGGSANCDSKYAGFSIQMYSAAELMRWYIDSMSQSWWNYKKPYQKNYILWNVEPSKCGGSNVYLHNKATAALYTYTPYQPNKSALNNMYGTGNRCAAYGNRNFWRVYNDWFGKSRSGPSKQEQAKTAIDKRYKSLNGSSGTLGKTVGSIKGSGGSYWIQYANGFIIWGPKSGAWESFGDIRTRWLQLGTEKGTMGHPTGAIITMNDGGLYQKYQNGFIIGKKSTGFWESKGMIRDKWATIGYQDGSLGYPTGPEKNAARNVWYQKYEKGYVYGAGPTGFWITSNAVFNHWLAKGGANNPYGLPTQDLKNMAGRSEQTLSKAVILDDHKGGVHTIPNAIHKAYNSLGGTTGVLGVPIAKSAGDGSDMTWQRFKNGYIIGKNKTGFYESRGPIRDRWAALGYQNSQLGMPLRNITTGADKKTTWQKYQGGYIISDPNNKNVAWESTGDIRTQWSKLGFQDGILGYPTGPEKRINGVWTQTYQNGVIYSKNWKHWYTVNKK